MLWLQNRLVAFASCLALLFFLGLDGSPAFAERPLIADLRWIQPDADAVEFLTKNRAECSVVSKGAGRDRLVRLGRVAFRSPRLLGGLAARVGMSCDSCHRNGHDNPVFRFAGVSGDPGTADVTGSVFSTNREDGIFNPVVIPSLVDAASSPPFGTKVPAADLRSFLHAVVVDEFQGESPPISVAEGLFAYVESLQSVACPTLRNEVLAFETDSSDVLGTLEVVVERLEEDDRPGAMFTLGSLRAALERVYRRFPEQVSAREDLIDSSRAFSSLRERLDEAGRAETLASLATERLRLESNLRKLEAKVDASFYDPHVLRSVLESDPSEH